MWIVGQYSDASQPGGMCWDISGSSGFDLKGPAGIVKHYLIQKQISLPKNKRRSPCRKEIDRHGWCPKVTALRRHEHGYTRIIIFTQSATFSCLDQSSILMQGVQMVLSFPPGLKGQSPLMWGWPQHVAVNPQIDGWRGSVIYTPLLPVPPLRIPHRTRRN